MALCLRQIVRKLPPLYRRVPTQAFVEPYVMDARPLYLVFTIEAARRYSRRTARAHGQPRIRLRHLPGRLSVEPPRPRNSEKRIPPQNFSRSSQNPLLEDTPGENIESLIPPETAESQEESFSLPRLEWLAAMDETEFRRICRGSAIKRTKWRGFVRNACIALGNSDLRRGTPSHERIRELLQGPFFFGRRGDRGIRPLGALTHPMIGER